MVINKRMPITSRLDINLGYKCNNNCLFCYFKNRKEHCTNLTIVEAKKRLIFIKKLGIDTAEFTGGEVTLRNDIIELISFAKKDLQFKKITIITNGSKLCNEKFAARVKDAGVDDILISIHGHNAKLHDLLSGRKNAFEEAVIAINNILKLGISCRTNTVVTKLNFQKIPEIVSVLYNMGVGKVNYIFFSPLDDACRVDRRLWLTYSEAVPFVKEMINKYNNKFETISIKAIPFCFLEGYEDYITNFFQNIYDPYEWDYYCRVHIRRNAFICNVATIGGMVLFMDVGRMMEIGLRKSLREAIVRTEAFRHCVKTKLCKSCKFDFICPGIWKLYAKHFGLDEIKPIKGKKLIEVDCCVRKRFSDYYEI